MTTNYFFGLFFFTFIITTTAGIKCFQCGELSGLPCQLFDTDKIEYQKVCNDTVQSCITQFLGGAVNFRDCWTNKVDSVKCDGHTNSLKLCYCANSDFCNCHNNPNLNGEECPIPPSSTNKVCLPITLLLVSLFIITFTNRLEV